MGWVTLTLRKTELKRSHADYQMELLRISREKRQNARKSHYDQLVINNDGQNDLNSLYADYKAQRDGIKGQYGVGTSNGETGADPNTTHANGQQGGTAGGNNNSSSGSTIDSQAYATMQEALNEAKEEYEMKKMNIKNEMEEELQSIEEEANDLETQLDQEQVEVEAQLEAISQEIEAVGQAISSQIQASTIKLS